MTPFLSYKLRAQSCKTAPHPLHKSTASLDCHWCFMLNGYKLEASITPLLLLLLLLLSCFSHVQLCATPQMAAHQAPPSLGFSRQEHWSGLPFPSLMHESESKVTQSCPTLSDPMDCSPPGSSIHGIFQARVPEWAAIAFSEPHLLGLINLPKWLRAQRNILLTRLPVYFYKRI